MALNFGEELLIIQKEYDEIIDYSNNDVLSKKINVFLDLSALIFYFYQINVIFGALIFILSVLLFSFYKIFNIRLKNQQVFVDITELGTILQKTAHYEKNQN